jgi:UDP-glucuronate 4-epimerase
MRMLLTGGAGFIGSHLAERLLERGAQLTIIDNLNDFYNPEIKRRNLERVREKGEFTFCRQDILNRKAMTDLFRNFRPQIVVHLAAYAGVRPSLENPGLYSEVNVTGTSFLLEEARLGEVEHFVFGSSSSVYGINSKVPFHEDDSVHQPISPYAVTKRAGELLCFSYHHNYGLPITSLRFFTVYGPRQRPEMAIHKFTRDIDQGKEIPVYHEGRSARDYTYVDDIVHGVLSAIDQPQGCSIFNLGNSHVVPLSRLIAVVEQALGKKARTRLMPAQPGDVPITSADISRARERLGYIPRTDIEEGVSRFVRWYREEMQQQR